MAVKLASARGRKEGRKEGRKDWNQNDKGIVLYTQDNLDSQRDMTLLACILIVEYLTRR